MKSISQYSYKPGQAVAFLIDGAIRFGNVATVITKQDTKGERTAVQVDVRNIIPGEVETDGEPERFLIPRGDLIDDIPGPDDLYGSLKLLVLESSEYKTAMATQSAIFNPPPAVATPTAEPAQVDTARPPEADEDVPL